MQFGNYLSESKIILLSNCLSSTLLPIKDYYWAQNHCKTGHTQRVRPLHIPRAAKGAIKEKNERRFFDNSKVLLQLDCVICRYITLSIHYKVQIDAGRVSHIAIRCHTTRLCTPSRVWRASLELCYCAPWRWSLRPLLRPWTSLLLSVVPLATKNAMPGAHFWTSETSVC